MLAPGGIAVRVLEQVAGHLAGRVLRQVGGLVERRHVLEVVGPRVRLQRMREHPVPRGLPSPTPGVDVAEPEPRELVEQPQRGREVGAVLLAHEPCLGDDAERPGRPRRVARPHVSRERSRPGERGFPVARVSRELPCDEVREPELADLVGLDHAIAVAAAELRRVVGARVAEVVGAAVDERAVVRAGVGHLWPGPGAVRRGRAVRDLVVEHALHELDHAAIARVRVVERRALREPCVERRRVVRPAPAAKALGRRSSSTRARWAARCPPRGSPSAAARTRAARPPGRLRPSGRPTTAAFRRRRATPDAPPACRSPPRAIRAGKGRTP